MTMARECLHVVQISFFSDPARRSPAELLVAWPTLVDVAEAGERAGIRVSVVQASTHSERLTRKGVRYYFLPFGKAPSTSADRKTFRELLRSLAPDVFHVHGLSFTRDVLSLHTLAPTVPIVLQDHADGTPRFWRRPAWRRSMSVAAGICFCALDQARPFIEAGLVAGRTQRYTIPESTCRFTPAEQDEARRIAGVEGAPAVLWVGHLDANKDPLTVLEGISAAMRELPGLRLFCCFGTAPLLDQVRSRIAADPLLRANVHLLGRVPHEQVEQLMRAADVFVAGSHREGSGYSLIEALACGLSPVVTDIPSFRALTGDGRVGSLWRCGDARSLREALLSVAARVNSATRAEVRAHFERELSFEALGSKLVAMYQDVLARQRAHSGRSAEVASGLIP